MYLWSNTGPTNSKMLFLMPATLTPMFMRFKDSPWISSNWNLHTDKLLSLAHPESLNTRYSILSVSCSHAASCLHPPLGNELQAHLSGTNCKYGDSCRFSHDVEGFLKSKPLDIPGTCPFSSVTTGCPYGVACRFYRSHGSNGFADEAADKVRKTWTSDPTLLVFSFLAAPGEHYRWMNIHLPYCVFDTTRNAWTLCIRFMDCTRLFPQREMSDNILKYSNPNTHVVFCGWCLVMDRAHTSIGWKVCIRCFTATKWVVLFMMRQFPAILTETTGIGGGIMSPTTAWLLVFLVHLQHVMRSRQAFRS